MLSEPGLEEREGRRVVVTARVREPEVVVKTSVMVEEPVLVKIAETG